MLLPHALRAVKKGEVSFIASSSADGSTSGVLTLTTPTGTQAGDLLVAFGYSASAGSLWSVDGGGWTITNAATTTAPRLTAFYFTHVAHLVIPLDRIVQVLPQALLLCRSVGVLLMCTVV